MRQVAWLIVGLAVVGFGRCLQNTAAAADADKQMPVVLNEDFENGMGRWETTDPDSQGSVWHISKLQKGPDDVDNHVLTVTGQSQYEPTYRSPFSIAWLKDVKVGDFELTVRVQNTRSQCRQPPRPLHFLGPAEPLAILLRPFRQAARSAFLPDIHRQQCRPHDDHPRPGRGHQVG